MRDLTIIEELSSELSSSEEVSVGGDIELFISDEMSGKVISASELIGGDKDNPQQLGEGVFVHPDNIMLEFGFTQGSTKKEFTSNLGRAISEVMRNFDGKNVEIQGMQKFTNLLFLPALDITESMDELISYEKFFEVGCDPFRTAYNDKGIAFSADDLGDFRYASGHTHIGYANSDIAKNKEIVQNFDFFYLSFLEKLLEESKKRQSTYGTAGALRHKPYGVEYRTPSNLWVNDFAGEMFDIASLSAKLAMEGIVVDRTISANARLLKDNAVYDEIKSLFTRIKTKKRNGENKKVAA